MKWIGQHIWQFISRFRDDVYLENLSTTTETSALVVDSGGKVSKNVTSGVNLANGADNRIVTAVGTNGLNAEANLTFDGTSFSCTTDTVTLTSVNANDPALIIENTTDDNESARIKFNTNRGADGQDGDKIGAIEFWGYDDGTPTAEQYGKIFTEIHDATSDQESGSMQLRVASHDGELQPGLIITGGSVEDEVDVTVGTGTASVTTIAGDLTVTGSDLTFDSVALTGIQTSAESFVDDDVSLMTSAAIADKIAAIGSSSDSAAGLVELATVGEADTGTDTTRAVTPAGVKSHVESRKIHELTAPTSALAMNSQKITGAADPTADQDVATKVYSDTSGPQHYRFMGYTTGDGSNYETLQPLTDAQAPWEHATTTSGDGLTVAAAGGTNISDLFRFGGYVMPRAGTLKLWVGWATNNNASDLTIGIFKWTPTDNVNTSVNPVLLDATTITGAGNDKVRSFSETSFTDVEVAAGDIIFSQMKTEGSGNIAYFQSTLEVLF